MVTDESQLLGTVTTAGWYLCLYRPASGNYIVRIPADEFTAGDLVGYVTSTGPANGYEPAPDADTDTTDSDDNGTQTGGVTGSGGYVQSEIVTLTPAGEDIYDNNTGTTSEPRLDFGFTPQSRSYTITKTVTDVGNDGAGGSVDQAGDVITYQVVVENTGNQTITGVTLSDSLVSNVGAYTESGTVNGNLDVGETWTWSYTYTVEQYVLDENG